jgi:hypothetical protein
MGLGQPFFVHPGPARHSALVARSTSDASRLLPRVHRRDRPRNHSRMLAT